MRVFADADQLRAARGEELGTSDWLTITQERINQFADATLDHQWIHTDAERAAAGPFGTTIAHGYLTLSLISALNSGLYRLEGVRLVINYGLNKVRFPAPVPVGARVRARSVLSDVADIEGGLQLTVTVTVEIEGQDKPACVAETLSRLML